jgi:hypothetical protein
MDKNNPPRSFGVFKPTGHTVIAFETQSQASQAQQALLQCGFDGDAIVHYTPQEMQAQVASDLHTASPIAAVGQELNLVRAHGELADAGCHFLVVHTPDNQQVQTVCEIIDSMGAKAAQRYGAFIVEDLKGTPKGKTQSFESPDRGLDLKVSADAATR